MRVRSRQRYATPFVLIVGCSGGPRTEPARPPDPIAFAREMDALPDPVSVPTDAAVADAAGIDARTSPPDPNNPKDLPRFDPCGGPPYPNKPTCNPPSPSAVAVIGEVIDIERSANALIIIIGRGRRDGVDTNWRAELINDSGAPIAAGTLIVFKVAERATYVRVRGIRDLPGANQRVRLSPR